MRIHLRRTVSFAICGTCCVIFFITILQNTHHLAALQEYNMADDSRQLIRAADDTSRGNEADKAASSGNRHINIWTSGADEWNDRIREQLSYIPKYYNANASALKYIYVPGGLFDTSMGSEKFVSESCLVDKCYLTTQAAYRSRADAVLLQNSLDGMGMVKQPGQIWILWMLESPLNSIHLGWLANSGVNWTASYRSDSTIVTPYEKFVPYPNFTGLPNNPARNYAKGKTKKVAWFVSNCNALNRRMPYVRQLKKYISVDIYGACGQYRCKRDDPNDRCDKLLNTDYKFYLSFENSNCEYYITEKLYWNALLNDVVPVVMGARKEDYLAAAPPQSYIHVEDFPSAELLAEYLLKLDENDDMYNQYFRWKHTGGFINTKFWCRLCAMLHDVDKPTIVYDDIEVWWRRNGTCTKDRWDEPENLISTWRDAYMT